MIYGIFYDTEHYCDIMAYPNQTEDAVKEMLKIIAEDIITTNEEDGYTCIEQTTSEDETQVYLEFQKPDDDDWFYISLEVVSKENENSDNWLFN